MMGKVDFQHDKARDIVVATPHWKLETEQDVKDWFAQYESYLGKFGRKMDIVAVLDNFEVAPVIGQFWGQYRAKLHQSFTRFSFRVHSKNTVKLFVNTSGVRYNVATEEAATVEDAMEGILAARKAANVPQSA